MRGFGIILMLVGIVFLFGAIVFDPSVESYSTYGYSRVANIQGLTIQVGLILVGGFSFVSGSIFVAGAVIVERLGKLPELLIEKSQDARHELAGTAVH